jgi:hypothetical protein
MAERLMAKWNIEVEAELEVDPGDTSEISFMVTPKCVPWRATLGEAMASLYDCKATVTKDRKQEEPRFWLRFFGEPAALFRLRLHYRYLETEIELLVQHFRPRSIRHVRALGAARYVAHLVETYLKGPNPAEPHGERVQVDTIFEPQPESRPELEPELSAATALAKIPRQRVRAPREEKPAPPPAPDHVLEVDLPERQQNLGVEAAANQRSIRVYAAKPHPALDLPIEAVAMGGKRAKAALRSLNVRYVGELVAMTAFQLTSIPGVGRVTLSMIETDLSLEGLHLRPQDPFEED